MNYFIDNWYKDRYAICIEQMVKFKFPSIKIVYCEFEDDNIVLKFEDDGVHSNEMVTDFVNKTLE